LLIIVLFAGIVLILENDERRYLERVTALVEEYSLPIDVWMMEK